MGAIDRDRQLVEVQQTHRASPHVGVLDARTTDQCPPVRAHDEQDPRGARRQSRGDGLGGRRHRDWGAERSASPYDHAVVSETTKRVQETTNLSAAGASTRTRTAPAALNDLDQTWTLAPGCHAHAAAGRETRPSPSPVGSCNGVEQVGVRRGMADRPKRCDQTGVLVSHAAAWTRNNPEQLGEPTPSECASRLTRYDRIVALKSARYARYARPRTDWRADQHRDS